jgi:hypothetical protein
MLVAGCSSIPFEKTSFVTMSGVDPQEIVEKYKKSLPEHYQVLNTILFTYGWNKFTALGYVDVNIRTKSFTVASMNPMGVKLFQLSGNENGIDTHFMLKELEKQGDFASFIGEDMRRVYFDLIPTPTAEIIKKKDRLVFRQASGNGVFVHVFAGAEGLLVEKDHYRDNTLHWRVSYYNYRREGDKIYPGGIIFNNYKYGYSLTVTLKEIHS